MVAFSHGTAIMARVFLAINSVASISERKAKRQAYASWDKVPLHSPWIVYV